MLTNIRNRGRRLNKTPTALRLESLERLLVLKLLVRKVFMVYESELRSKRTGIHKPGWFLMLWLEEGKEIQAYELDSEYSDGQELIDLGQRREFLWIYKNSSVYSWNRPSVVSITNHLHFIISLMSKYFNSIKTWLLASYSSASIYCSKQCLCYHYRCHCFSRRTL